MNFNTALFLFLFLPFFLIAYFIAQPRWRPVVGILASVIFYAWGSAVNLVFIAALIVANYWLARLFTSRFSKWILPLGLLVNVGVLVFFKLFTAYQYTLFFGLDRFFPARLISLLDSLTFPLGLSFISFQLISYLLDVHKKATPPEKNFIAFAFYVLMFPKLLVGPIVRYRSIADQLPSPTINSDQIANGIRRFLKGFAKKILIADVLGVTVDAVFGLPTSALTPAYAWIGLVGYALQIYFDFSGYTDMAIGLAAMMGFRFIENFDLPYLAQSIGDFWRRWHISLSTWFRDYVFFPLERKRVPPHRAIVERPHCLFANRSVARRHDQFCGVGFASWFLHRSRKFVSQPLVTKIISTHPSSLRADNYFIHVVDLPFAESRIHS
jgi:alginate O-acetyltransferase complex protein AlgI